MTALRVNELTNIGEAMPRARRLGRMQDLGPGQNHRLREAMKKLRDERYEGNVTALAVALGRAQPSISDFLNGKTGASYETAIRFAALMKEPIEKILGPRDQPPPFVQRIVDPDQIYTHLREAMNRREGKWSQVVREQLLTIRLGEGDEPVDWWLDRGDGLAREERLGEASRLRLVPPPPSGDDDDGGDPGKKLRAAEKSKRKSK